MVAHCFESDPCELLARVHDRYPVWTRLELAAVSPVLALAEGSFMKYLKKPGNWPEQIEIPT
jgi:hypothetical protein